MESLTDLCWAGSEEAVKTRAAAMSGAFFMFILGAAAVGALWADDAMHCKSPMLRSALLLSLAASCGGTSPCSILRQTPGASLLPCRRRGMESSAPRSETTSTCQADRRLPASQP